MKKLFIALASVVMLSACAPTVIKGNLSTATYEQIPVGATYSVLQGSQSLTDRHIEGLIRKEMDSRGFKYIDDPESASIAVGYTYAVGNGRMGVTSSPDFVWGGQKVESYTTYPRYFQIALMDVPASLSKKKATYLWQAEIQSSGSMNNMSVLAESFVPELFKDFGKNVTNDRFLIPTTVPLI